MNKSSNNWDFPYTKSISAEQMYPARHKPKGFIRKCVAVLPLLSVVISSTLVSDAMANGGGITGHSKSRSTCSNCHNGARFNSTVVIEGEQNVVPGSLNEFVINLTHDGSEGGFNMSASGGSLEPTTLMRKQDDELTHIRPQDVTNGGNSWTVEWEAPSESGTQTLYVCANAVNGNGNTSGDESITACNTLDVIVGSLNETPDATNDTASLDEDSSVTIDVLSNDSDGDGSLDTSSVAIVSNVSSGAATVNSSGSVTYTPSVNFNGSDTFTYTVADNEGAVSEAATVTITVRSVNDIPVASNDSASTSEETSITIDVLANDSDVEDSLVGANIEIQSAPDNGTAQVVGNNVSYSPDEDFSGSDSFTYRVNDSDGGSSQIATVDITVVAVNDAPQAMDDTATTDEDNAVTIDILGNDSDTDGTLDPASIEIITQTINGDTSISSGSVIYTPDANFNGSDTFTYRVADNEGRSSNTATVSIAVSSVNDAPVASDDLQGTNIDTSVAISVLDNDSDDGNLDPTSIEIVMAPGNGAALADSTGVITYTPNNGFAGQDSFTYTVNDTEGLSSNTATVSVSVRINEVPTANSDTAQTDEDMAVTINVLANDSDDIELNPESVQIVDTPENGSATVLNTGEIRYQPNTDFFGDDAFTYQVGDFENGTSPAAQVSISVAAINDVPVFVSEPAESVVQGQSFSYDIVVSDVDSEELIVSLVSGPDWLVLDELSLSGTAPLSAIGNNDVELEVSDGTASNQQRFTILVTERTDADLSLSATTSEVAGIVGESLVYQITVVNNGPADANNVEVMASWNGVSGNFMLSDACTADGSSDGKSVSCLLDTVTAEQPATLNIGFVAESFGDVVTNIQVNFSQESDASNNQVQMGRSIAGSLSQPVTLSDESGRSVVAVADLNDDGFVDMARSSAGFNELVIQLNNGKGQLLIETLTPLGGTITALDFAQLDSDSEVELLVVLNGSELVIMNTEDGVNYSESSRMMFSDIQDVRVADLNNDGAMDIVLAQQSAINMVLKNQGDSSFVEETLGMDGSLAVAAIDVNGDMYPELVFANGANANSVYVNQNMMMDDMSWFGAGSELSAENSVDVRAIDVNGDMRYELVFANNGLVGNTLYQSLEGNLSLMSTLGLAGTSQSLVADFNGDGAIDLLFVQESGVLQQWLNDGAGQFNLASQALLIKDASGFAVADFNGDGMSDLAVTASQQDVVINDNSSGFAPVSVDLSVSATFSVNAVSVDVVSVGDSWSYTVTTTNNSDDFDGVNGVLMLSVPESLGASNLADTCAFTDGIWSCPLDNLDAGAAPSLTIEGQIQQGASGSLAINADVSNVVADSDLTNNTVETAIIVNAAPIASNDSIVVEHNESIVISVLSNDTDDIGIDTSSVTIVTGPANGTATVSGSGSISYTPTTDFSGSDSLTYEVSDSNGSVSNVATVSITVNEKPDDGGAIGQFMMMIVILLVAIRRMSISGKKGVFRVCKG